jgi:peptidoglycan/LPS O-acetylase OafA/YrhL
MNFQTMNKQRKFILIAAAVGIIGMFLPWFDLFFMSINGMHSWGLLAFLSFAGAGVVAFLGDQTKNLEKTSWFIALSCGAIATLITVIFLLRYIGEAGMTGLGVGIYVATLGAIGTLLAAYMYRSPTDSIKGGFDSLKHDIEEKTKNTNPPPPPQP